ncbi:DEAD/DEAH box helicase [Blastopirellula marina]|uniref:ATP-dependent helicase n=1 Tax=Blastopirellula marina TaxID=124 RepID=A0A2S8F9U9_9BACT|nr:DEAD/DEAH box helicase [Blastopirellula marina]PQO28925.1 ATP-dependent helicase [Blastopirellula marina]PTL42198.1 ATP-dependent helicase [Blastopirellula marina]
MSNFDRLHPALQHHIVNSLSWRELRPFQEAVISPILDGQHLIVLAPTAGGKTEAAFFPVVSRMLTEGWTGLSVLYLCPIKALLNNLDVRLQRYSTLLGRRSALWHGDVKPTARKKILREPPDSLLTTPESLEVMLDSPSVDSRSLFAELQVVIVDEIHAFAGDDRGWHLLSVLERISKLAGRELQRIGLSATVGNPETLSGWLAGSCKGPRDVFFPPSSGGGQADVQLDFVGSLQNAALVISRLHRGEKRLVFVDSRSRAEQLAAELRNLQVTTFVTHSSLSQDQRHQAEEAFASRDDCVIVATSVLELGIDVGNLDRVIQIDSPPTVSSFLQRMGRTGRRSGTMRNCLFLATKDETLVQASALINLWGEDYVEPIEPPAMPIHVLAQQLMALTLQEGGIGRAEWFSWLKGVPGFQTIPPENVEYLVSSMLEREILWEDAGILAMGKEGESTYGRRNFLELFSVFMSPPIFSILHGRQEIGYVDIMTFLGKHEGPRILLLGGRAWKVNHIDWRRRMAYVEPTDATGRSRWMGEGQGLGFRMAQAIKHVLATDNTEDYLSRRAAERIGEIRQEFAWVDPDSTIAILAGAGEVEWWTYGGFRANATFSHALSLATNSKVKHDSFKLTFEPSLKQQDVERAIEAIRQLDVAEMRPVVDDAAIDSLKFSECLPAELAIEMVQCRLQEPEAIRQVLKRQVRSIVK